MTFDRNKQNVLASELTPKDEYARLKALYDNNGLYDSVSQQAYQSSAWIEALKPLRTVVNRSVEFFASKVLPGDSVGVVTDSDTVKDAIEQVLRWSNFAGKKQTYVRNLALYGDLFLKVVSTDKVYFEEIEPQYVTSFTADSRGYLTSIRIDIPIEDENHRILTHTELWSKEYFAIWIHSRGENAPLDQLGDPVDFAFLQELGIDFIPIVHIKFRDTGELRGKACVAHAIDKINEANREATRLSQMLFRYNKAIWAVSANSVDSNGIATPPPRMSTKSKSNIANTDDVIIGDNSIVYLPGNSKLESLVPNINYGDALSVLNAMMDELEQDLPELRYYSIQDSNLSGKAIRLLLAGAVDRAEDARNNLTQGLVRVIQIALTLGKNLGIFTSTIGSYENDNFELTLVCDEMFGMDISDKATTLKVLVDSGLALPAAMRIMGFSEEEIAEAVEVPVQEGA